MLFLYVIFTLKQRTGAHGFSVWTHYKQVCWNFWNNISSCNAVDMRGSCHQYGGPHWNSHDFAVYGSEVCYQSICMYVCIYDIILACICMYIYTVSNYLCLSIHKSERSRSKLASHCRHSSFAWRAASV